MPWLTAMTIPFSQERSTNRQSGSVRRRDPLLTGATQAGVAHVRKERGRRRKHRPVRASPLSCEPAGVITVPGVGQPGDLTLDLVHESDDLPGQPAEDAPLRLDHVGVHPRPRTATAVLTCVVHIQSLSKDVPTPWRPWAE